MAKPAVTKNRLDGVGVGTPPKKAKGGGVLLSFFLRGGDPFSNFFLFLSKPPCNTTTARLTKRKEGERGHFLCFLSFFENRLRPTTKEEEGGEKIEGGVPNRISQMTV